MTSRPSWCRCCSVAKSCLTLCGPMDRGNYFCNENNNQLIQWNQISCFECQTRDLNRPCPRSAEGTAAHKVRFSVRRAREAGRASPCPFCTALGRQGGHHPAPSARRWGSLRHWPASVALECQPPGQGGPSPLGKGLYCRHVQLLPVGQGLGFGNLHHRLHGRIQLFVQPHGASGANQHKAISDGVAHGWRKAGKELVIQMVLPSPGRPRR